MLTAFFAVFHDFHAARGFSHSAVIRNASKPSGESFRRVSCVFSVHASASDASARAATPEYHLRVLMHACPHAANLLPFLRTALSPRQRDRRKKPNHE